MQKSSWVRYVWMAVAVLVVVGAIGGYQLYQMRQENKRLGESFGETANQIDKLAGTPSTARR